MKYNALDTRMKDYEYQTRAYLPEQSHVILRIDGRAFHAFTRGLNKPFDADLVQALDRTAEALCAELGGTQFAFTQSDELSLYLTDTTSPVAQFMFGGGLQKLTSVSASIATAHFNRLWTKTDKLATFDARIFSLPAEEVNNYFISRQRDAMRNSIQSLAQSIFSHRELHQKNTAEMKIMLRYCGVPWEDVPLGLRQGRLTQKVQRVMPISFTDKRNGEVKTLTVSKGFWQTEAAPLFSETNGDIMSLCREPSVSV